MLADLEIQAFVCSPYWYLYMHLYLHLYLYLYLYMYMYLNLYLSVHCTAYTGSDWAAGEQKESR